MAKIVLEDLTNLRNEASVVAAINRNNAKIEAAVEVMLSRDGTSPNTMQSNLDMNSNRIINLSDPVDDNDLATKAYVDENVLGIALGEDVVLTSAGRAILDDLSADDQLTTLGATSIGKAVLSALTEEEAREALGIFSTGVAFSKTKHVADYSSFTEALNAIEDGDRLLLTGGETYTYSSGALTSWPDNFIIDSDNGLPWVLDFSGNASWYPTGLINVTASLVPASQEPLTANLTATTDSVQASSATAVGQTVTMDTSGAHGLSTGDWVFIRYGSATTASQAAYCTEYDSDEGQSLDKPVQVTVTSSTQFTYTAYSGTPAATMTIYPYIYKNNQVAKVADSSEYAVGDLVFIESDGEWESFTGTQTMELAELNEVGRIIDSTTIWLRLPVKFSYTTADNAKITKVTKKRPILMNGKIIGNGVYEAKPYYTYSDIGALFHLCFRPLLVNMQFEQCDFMGNWMRSCYFPLLINCRDTKPLEDAAGRYTGKIETEYGFCWGNATRGYLAVDCEATGGRHGFDEACTATYKGMPVDCTLVRPRAYDQWSTNIDTHGTSWNLRIIDPVIRGGDGIACRNGSIVCTGIRAYGSKRAFNAYGRVVDVTVSVDEADCTLQDVVSIVPSSDIVTPTPDSTGIKILHVNSKNGGIIGVRVQSAANQKIIAPYVGPIQCDGVSSYALYMTNGSGGEIVAPHVVSVTSEDFGSYVAYLGKVTNGYFGGMFGRKAGSFTVCVVSDSAATNNTFDNVRGVSTDAGTVTKFSMPSASSGNFTNSLEYESLTIASGAVTCKWRNVPLKIIDTESSAATDDLDTINGLSYGDTAVIRSSVSTRDPTLRSGVGNIYIGKNRTLRTTSEVCVLFHNGVGLFTESYGDYLYGSATYDPASLVDAAGVTTTVTVTGAELGDFATASFSNDLQGITLTAWVSASNTVSVRFQNESGGTLDLASGTLRARVEKA